MTIEKVMAAVDSAIEKALAAQRANWEGDEDECTQRAHAEHHRDMARRAILALAGEWPKLDKPARADGGTFHVGVSAKLVVRAAQAAYANEAERRAMTKEQRQADERNRRELWDMINGPLEAKP